MRGRMVGLSALALLAACASAEPDDAANFVNVDETLTTENIVANDITAVDASLPEPAQPSHRYAFREGDLYGYIAAISEEESKRGKAAGDVVMYRYKGFWESADHIEQVDATGRTVGINECNRPCVAIKSTYYGRFERMAFNPSSIIGAAFQDAMNGKLEAPRSTPMPRAPDPYAGYNSVQEYREAVANNGAPEVSAPTED